MHRIIPTLLAHTDGDGSRSTRTYQGTQGRRQIHDRHRQGQARDGQRSNAVTNKNAVDDVIERTGGRCDNGRQGVTQQQPADSLVL